MEPSTAPPEDAGAGRYPDDDLPGFRDFPPGSPGTPETGAQGSRTSPTVAPAPPRGAPPPNTPPETRPLRAEAALGPRTSVAVVTGAVLLLATALALALVAAALGGPPFG